MLFFLYSYVSATYIIEAMAAANAYQKMMGRREKLESMQTQQSYPVSSGSVLADEKHSINHDYVERKRSPSFLLSSTESKDKESSQERV